MTPSASAPWSLACPNSRVCLTRARHPGWREVQPVAPHHHLQLLKAQGGSESARDSWETLGVSFGDDLYPGMGPWGRKPLRCSFWIILWLWALARCFRTPTTRYLWKGLCDWVGMWLQGSCATIMYFFTSCQLRPSSANSSCQISGTLGFVRWCWGSQGIHISITITINANGASTPPRRIRKFNS